MSGEPRTDRHRPIPLVEARDLTFGYAAVPVVEDVNLRVERGEYVGIVGPNGSGRARCSGSSWGSMSLIRGLRSCSTSSSGVRGARARRLRRTGRDGRRETDADHGERGRLNGPVPARRVRSRDRGRPKARARRFGPSGSSTSPTARSPRSPAASASGPTSPGRSPARRSYSSWTSRRLAWTPSPSTPSSSSSTDSSRTG